jgi:geranylgeranyl diphosphate synthase type II
MVLKKTCWLATIHPVRLGALIAVAGRVDPTAFIRFGFFLGAAFQIQDDVLNLAGDEAAYGKETCGDLREGKRTLMLIRLLQLASPGERARLVAHLGTPLPARRQDDIDWIRARIDHYDCLAYARQVAHAMAGAALAEYTRLFARVPASRDRAFVEGLITWVVARTS